MLLLLLACLGAAAGAGGAVDDGASLVLLSEDEANTVLPLRLIRGPGALSEARLAVARHDLASRAVAHCVSGDGDCVARLLVERTESRAADVPCFLDAAVVDATSRRIDVEVRVQRSSDGAAAPFTGQLFVDVWRVGDENVEGDPFAAWLDVGATDGGRFSFWVDRFATNFSRGTLRASLAAAVNAQGCGGGMWFHAGLVVDLAVAGPEGDGSAIVGTDAAEYGVGGSLVLMKAAGEAALPLRFALPTTRADLFRQATAAVERFALARNAVANCGEGERRCVAELLAAQALLPLEAAPRCRLVLDRPRQNEVVVLGHVDAEVAAEIRDGNGTWVRGGKFVGRLHVDAWPTRPGAALSTWRPIHGWLDIAPEDHGHVTVRLRPPYRRPGGGGSARYPVDGEVQLSLAAFGSMEGCGPAAWIHAGARVTYRPFAEPDPPAPVLDRDALGRRARGGYSRAYATILYGTARDSGYAHGALTLLRSIRDRGSKYPFYALLGADVDGTTRRALAAAGARLVDVAPAISGEAASALPALGIGQWAKLALWDLPEDRVLYLDADAVVLLNVDEVFAGLDGGAAVGAVDDYFTGGFLLLAPGIPQAFAETLGMDARRYVYGEQDFLNVHFAAGAETRVRLGAEYKCSASAAAARGEGANGCAVLEFSSCPTLRGGAWKPWHGTRMFGPGFRVCASDANESLAALAGTWAEIHARALAQLPENLSLPPPSPYEDAPTSLARPPIR